MKTSLKTAVAALAFATVGWVGAANAQPYDPNYPPPDSYYDNQGAPPDSGYYPAPDNGYYPPDNGYYDQDLPPPPADYGYYAPSGGISFSIDSGGYCDMWGCPDDFWNLPLYYGPVFFGGSWFDGPVYYRDWYGQRQFWLHGGWRYDEWRGARPSWWHAGRVGPALGLSFYRDHAFHGRWDNDRRFDARRNFSRPENRNFGNRTFDNRNFGNRNFDNRGFNGQRDVGRNFQGRNNDAAPNRGGFMNFGRGVQQQQQQAPRSEPAPQARPQGRQGGGFMNFSRGAQQQQAPAPNFQGRADGRGLGHYNRPQQQADSNRGGGGGNNRGGDHGGGNDHGNGRGHR